MIYTLEERRVELRGEDHFVADSAAVIGAVVLENHVSVWFGAVVRGDHEPVVIGAETNIQDLSLLHTDPGCPLTVGRAVTVGHQAALHGCTVADGCLIGIKAVVLNNARIGRDCIVGANTLVTEGKQIPDGSLVMGVPGRVVRPLRPEEIAKVRDMANDYVRDFKRYKQDLRVQS